jgi:hypothetical protein
VRFHCAVDLLHFSISTAAIYPNFFSLEFFVTNYYRSCVTPLADIVPSSSCVAPQSQLLILLVFTRGCLHVLG